MESPTTTRGFAGLRVLSLESRRAPEMAKLIATYGGKPTVAPSMREVPLESNTEALAFVRALLQGDFDVVISLTGVGTRALARVVETAHPIGEFVAALRKVMVVARGPEPIAVLKEMGVPIALAAPEPNTWRELLHALDENKESVPLQGRKVAVQEYGVSNHELLDGLTQRGAHVTAVPVYEWALPTDVEPLRAAVTAVTQGEIDVVLFTSAMQLTNLLLVAAQMNLEDALLRVLAQTVIASIGPVTTERLREAGLDADIEPTHPKMGYLVSETAGRSAELFRRKHPAA